jgi:hypothetical protein
MLGLRNNEKNNLKEKNEILKSAYKDPFDMLFETVMEKEKKAQREVYQQPEAEEAVKEIM